eukprot:COSAG02_NODE_5817_length_4017_cov_2.230475_2_plen_163_part_00
MLPRSCQSWKLALGSSDARLQAYAGHVGLCVDGNVRLKLPEEFQKRLRDDVTCQNQPQLHVDQSNSRNTVFSANAHVADAFGRLMPALRIRPTSAVWVCKKDVPFHDISTLLSSEGPAHMIQFSIRHQVPSGACTCSQTSLTDMLGARYNLDSRLRWQVACH